MEKCRPVFLKREDRELLFESEAKAQEDAKKEREILERVEETKKKAVQELVENCVEQQARGEEIIAVNYDSDDMLPFADKDDNDEEYCASELAKELWKARELERILRER